MKMKMKLNQKMKMKKLRVSETSKVLTDELRRLLDEQGYYDTVKVEKKKKVKKKKK